MNRFIYEREMLSPDEGGGASVERNIGEAVDSDNAGGAAGAVLSSSGEVLVGLSAAQVRAEVEAGRVNNAKTEAGKSYLRIVCDNLLTWFNLIYAIVTVVLVSVGLISNLTYLFVVVPNVLIAIWQEASAKRAVAKLSVTTDPRATVVRDGALLDIDSSEIVLGELMRVELGRQVLCDAIVVDGVCEANESMLTGESVPIKKQAGDRILAGSFLVSGTVYARVDRVGEDNYVHSLEKEARAFKAPQSNLFRDLNKLIKTIGLVMIPLTIGAFIVNWINVASSSTHTGMELVQEIVRSTSGPIIGMIPAGMYLLVTLTLSLSVIKLSKKETMVQDMYSIEMLASADVLCLDKTGTITDGTMEVTAVRSLDGTDISELGRVMAYLEGEEDGINATSKALIAHFGKNRGEVRTRVPFSSARKYSAADIAEVGCYAIGAPHFVPCDISAELEGEIEAHAREGERVLILARVPSVGEDSCERGVAVALIAIADRIRPSARDTIARFQAQGVTVKVISGDHAGTVSTIARRVGIINAEKYLSCESISNDDLVAAVDDYAVFGRVTPEQKVLLVKALKAKGHTVAMTGDGVNDTLALKESDCAIAMADGSEVARQVSQIVLMNSDFASLPDVVNEGRRCINNVRQSSSLFLMKTIFTILVTLFAIVTVTKYPFGTNNFMFLELVVIGISSVALALEPNERRIEGAFLEGIIIKSLPSAVAMFLPIVAILIVGKLAGADFWSARDAVAMVSATLAGYINLWFICRPLTKWRKTVAIGAGVLLVLVGGAAVLVEGLVGESIFGFAYVLASPTFFGIMMAVTLVLPLVMHLFLAEPLKALITKIKNRRRVKNG
ncbi:MAG: HAD-IC family P-type ATPase [Clostridia bacterium]|nr:HAD-IC family P-type ATPase [Clostridia bacterium]